MVTDVEVKMSSKYSEEFKREIVALRSSGRTVVDLCRTYNLGKNTISQWMKMFDSSGNIRPKPGLSKEQQEMKSLRKELEDLRNRQEILQCAMSTLLKKKT